MVIHRISRYASSRPLEVEVVELRDALCMMKIKIMAPMVHGEGWVAGPFDR